MVLSCSSPFYYLLPVLDIDSWEQGFGVVHGYSLEGTCSVAVGRLSVLMVLTVAFRLRILWNIWLLSIHSMIFVS